MKLLSIDPSSTCTGYAVLNDEALLDAGKLRPNRVKDKPNERIDVMVADLVKLVAEYGPGIILMEDTSGKVSRRHGKGGGAGLAIYGKAVGEVRRAMMITGVRVECILENEWTRGCSEKAERKLWCQAAYPTQYDPAKDEGGDVADAIKMARWWLEVQRLRKPWVPPSREQEVQQLRQQ